jgi:phosphoribosyl 1,2-cyclic phosphate phosphodiesterase
MRVTILGCGASGGVPIATGSWGACNPLNPRNYRTRASIAVATSETTLLVDTSPDLREQCLREGIQKIDGVLYTHDHADHTHGIDDLKPFWYGHDKIPIDVYGNQETIAFLRARFGYAFPQRNPTPEIYRPFAMPHVIDGPFMIGDIPISPFVQDHGYSTSMGYRFDKVAYSTDVVALDEKAFAVLEGIETWIVDCIALDQRPSHSHLAQTLAWIERVKPRQAYLTHMSSLLDYDALLSMLPKGVEPAYDGLVIDLDP